MDTRHLFAENEIEVVRETRKTCSSSWEECVGKMTEEEELGHRTAEEPDGSA